MKVGIFTDSDFSKTNGVTTTLRAVLRHMPGDVAARVYTADDTGADEPDHLALRASQSARAVRHRAARSDGVGVCRWWRRARAAS